MLAAGVRHDGIFFSTRLHQESSIETDQNVNFHEKCSSPLFELIKNFHFFHSILLNFLIRRTICTNLLQAVRKWQVFHGKNIRNKRHADRIQQMHMWQSIHVIHMSRRVWFCCGNANYGVYDSSRQMSRCFEIKQIWISTATIPSATFNSDFLQQRSHQRISMQ